MSGKDGPHDGIRLRSKDLVSADRVYRSGVGRKIFERTLSAEKKMGRIRLFNDHASKDVLGAFSPVRGFPQVIVFLVVAARGEVQGRFAIRS